MTELFQLSFAHNYFLSVFEEAAFNIWIFNLVLIYCKCLMGKDVVFISCNQTTMMISFKLEWSAFTLCWVMKSTKLTYVEWTVRTERKLKYVLKGFQGNLLEELKYVKLMSLIRPKCRLHLYRADHILKQQERQKTHLVCGILFIRLLLQIADSVAQYFQWKHILMVLTANHFNLPHNLLLA